jgi:fructoselysine-6-P-deglycase FrlB-like protein
MTSNLYDLELERFPETFASAVRTDISGLTAAISEVSQECVIGVGSGGSFTVASLLCGLHEAFTGRISRPSTPLEIICRPALASSSPAFFISAEGKNPDIIEALQRARHHSSRALHVITNRQDSELLSAAADLTDIETHVFNLTDKDGFLATNSLLLNSVLVARAYTELDDRVSLPARIEELKLHEQSISEWLSEAREFAEEVVNRKGLIVVYSPDLRSIAIDIESKLAEAALLYCQTSDLRSFAHGRHLWISERPRDCAILALVDPALLPLWDQIRSLLPNKNYVLGRGCARRSSGRPRCWDASYLRFGEASR